MNKWIFRLYLWNLCSGLATMLRLCLQTLPGGSW